MFGPAGRAAAASVVALVALVAAAQIESRTASAEPEGLVEVSRAKRDGAIVWTMTVEFGPGFEGNADEVTDGIAAERGFDTSGAELTSSYVARQPWQGGAIPLAVRYNPNFDPLVGGQTPNQEARLSMQPSLESAIRTWNSVQGQSFSFHFAGQTSALTSACMQTPDGINVARFRPGLPDGVLGVTCRMSRITATGQTPIEFDMEISTSFTWSTGPSVPQNAYDLESTVLHELGHALGLDHSADPSAVMYYSAASGQAKRDLTADDIAGLLSLYGTGEPAPTPTPIRTATPAPTPAAPTPTTTPEADVRSSATVTPNGTFTVGANSVVIEGTTSASAVANAIASSAGRNVQAIWMLSDGTWLYYLPGAAEIDGGLRDFDGPVTSAFVILE